MKLPKLKFTEVDAGLYSTQGTQCRSGFEGTRVFEDLFSFDDCKYCFGKTGFDLYLIDTFIGNFPTKKATINFARNYDVPVEMIEFMTLSETVRNDFDNTTEPLNAKVYTILDTEGFDMAGCYITVKRNSFEGYYPCKVVNLEGRTIRQNY